MSFTHLTLAKEPMLKLMVRDGKFKFPLTITPVGKELEISFGYNEKILGEIKAMQGARWHGYDEVNPKKIWTINNSARNRFQLAYLGGAPVYARYDKPLTIIKCSRPEAMEHQHEMSSHMIERQQCIIACEMGTGKTLSAIEAMEWAFLNRGVKDWWWVGPKSALYSVMLEFKKWRAKVKPRFMTYDELRKVMSDPDTIVPQGIIGDESSRLKNPTAKRTEAFDAACEKMRAKYPDNAWVVEMSGTPSPKDPADWYSQCEIACPGFIREGNIHKFKNRLAVIVQKESFTGGVYPHLETWRDDEKKCNICGKLAGEPCHHPEYGDHEWEKSVNEVSYLYQRLMGLVLVKFKKDVLKHLPEKQYRRIYLDPSDETLRLANFVEDTSPSAIVSMTNLRELSDGFQYKDVEKGRTICPMCNGTKSFVRPVDVSNPYLPIDPASIACGHRIVYEDFGMPIEQLEAPLEVEDRAMPCEVCGATGEIVDKVRTIEYIGSPKEAALKELLDLHEEIGRFVIYGGFTGSIDLCVEIVKRCGWDYIRVDGRGWDSSLAGSPVELLEKFQEGKQVEKLAFIGQPGAAGMGLNLTASPGICFYSNDFNAESRHQAEARIHRPGMDCIRGATIYDLIHLDCDDAVLNNLNKKIDLQNMSMGLLKESIKNVKRGQDNGIGQ